MTHIFYLLVLTLMVYEVYWIFDINNRGEKAERSKKLSEAEKGMKWSEHSEEYKSLMAGYLFKLPFLITPFIGLFSAQWVLFGLGVIPTLFVTLIAKPFQYNIVWKALHVAICLWTAAMCLLAILNHYHLHIDMWQYLKSL